MMACSMTLAIDSASMRLLRSCASALDHAGLEEAAIEVYDRMLASHRLFAVEPAAKAGDPIVVRLAPYAELTLREAICIAKNERLDSATRESKIRAVLALAGY